MGILSKEEGDAVALENTSARGRAVIVCEHASRRIPRSLGTLGLSDEALHSHIAWDPGALAVARRLSERLDAPLVRQRFSRLVYDCNRPPEASAAMPESSEVFSVPGNKGLDQPAREALSQLLATRAAEGLRPVLVTVHSFTPVYFGQRRDVEIGILHDEDKRLAEAMLAAAGREGGRYNVRCNEPYGPADGVTHTLREHGLANGLANVMIEVRNDLIREEAGERAVADYLADLLVESLSSPELG